MTFLSLVGLHHVDTINQEEVVIKDHAIIEALVEVGAQGAVVSEDEGVEEVVDGKDNAKSSNDLFMMSSQ